MEQQPRELGRWVNKSEEKHQQSIYHKPLSFLKTDKRSCEQQALSTVNMPDLPPDKCSSFQRVLESPVSTTSTSHRQLAQPCRANHQYSRPNKSRRLPLIFVTCMPQCGSPAMAPTIPAQVASRARIEGLLEIDRPIVFNKLEIYTGYMLLTPPATNAHHTCTESEIQGESLLQTCC